MNDAVATKKIDFETFPLRSTQSSYQETRHNLWMTSMLLLSFILLLLEIYQFRTINAHFDDIFLKYGRGNATQSKEIEKIN